MSTITITGITDADIKLACEALTKWAEHLRGLARDHARELGKKDPRVVELRERADALDGAFHALLSARVAAATAGALAKSAAP